MKGTLFLVLALAACASERDDAPAAATSNEPRAVRDDDPRCAAFLVNDKGLTTEWLEAQAATGECGQPPRVVDVAAAVEAAAPFYAACDAIATSPTVCELGAGLQTCVAGRWTALCASNDDCAAGTVCVSALGVGEVAKELNPPFGHCEKGCASDKDCGRCDLVCDEKAGHCVTGGIADAGP